MFPQFTDISTVAMEHLNGDCVLGCSRKNPHPPTDGILEILVGGGSKTLEIQLRGGEGGLNLKKSSAWIILTDSMHDSNI